METIKQLFVRFRVLILTCVILLIFGVIAWFIYDAVTFRLKGTSPENNSQASSTTQIAEFSFNKKLVDDGLLDRLVTRIDGSPPSEIVIEDFQVVDGKILINLGILDIGKTYSFTITDIQSEGGKTIESVELSFESVYVPPKNQSEAERQAALQEVDASESNEPMLAITPFEGPEFTINYVEREPREEQPGPGEAKTEKTILVHIVMSNADYNTNEKKIVKERKERARNYLRSRGINLKGYTLEYSQDPFVGTPRQ